MKTVRQQTFQQHQQRHKLRVTTTPSLMRFLFSLSSLLLLFTISPWNHDNNDTKLLLFVQSFPLTTTTTTLPTSCSSLNLLGISSSSSSSSSRATRNDSFTNSYSKSSQSSLLLFLSNKNNNDNNDDDENLRFVGSISSSPSGGTTKVTIVTNTNTNANTKRSTGSLGIPKKKKNNTNNNDKQQNQSSFKSSGGGGDKKDRQRTGNGQIDSTKQLMLSDPGEEPIQVLEAKRGSKVVTIIRGMTSSMEIRKKILKEMKQSFGVGGTLVDGVLELQGAYAERAVQVLQKKGYSKARKIGK